MGTAGWVMNRKQDVKRFSHASPEIRTQSISLKRKMNVDPLELYCLLMAEAQELMAVSSCTIKYPIQQHTVKLKDALLSYYDATCIGYVFSFFFTFLIVPS